MRSLVATRIAAAVAATLMLAACRAVPKAPPSNGDSGNGREDSDFAHPAAEAFETGAMQSALAAVDRGTP